MQNKKEKFKILKNILGYYPHCERYFKYPVKRRTNTRYENEEDNYVYECKECYEITSEYFENMWNDL